MKKSGILWLMVLIVSQASARHSGGLQACWKKQVQPLSGRYLSVTYNEQLNELYHSPEPWQQMHYTGRGMVWYNPGVFLKQDTLTSGKRVLYSKTRLTDRALLLTDYGEKDQSAVTKGMLLDKLIETARYTPAPLVSYFMSKKTPPDNESNQVYSVYKTNINKTGVSLYIRNSDKHLVKITTSENDDLRGDVLSVFTYDDYRATGGVDYPETIRIDKVNGKVKDEVRINSAQIVLAVPALLEQPADYKTGEDAATVVQQLTTEKYSDNVHFINMLPTGSKIMVVEFRDFLLVAEAPLNSKNGELILSEAHKIAPGKPVKYFTFGHHHPDYIGGMRAFIHNGTTVLGVPEDSSYVSYLATAPHTLSPDSLQWQPRPLKWEPVMDSMMITDGSYAMHIYHIGKRSEHTDDYLIFYFPKEKLLFEGDLVWIKKDGPVSKAGGGQACLYHAVEDLRLDIKTIVQSWGIAFDKYKTIIPYGDLTQSVDLK